MKAKSLLLALAIAAAVPALAAPSGSSAQGYAAKTQRGELVHKIVKKWAPHVQELYRVPMAQWAKGMQSTFANVPLQQLQAAAGTDDFNAMNSVLLSDAMGKAAGGITPKDFGDLAQDLVYVPISPCRILDTRVASGEILAGTTRGVDVTAVSSYAFQGGASTDCNGLGTAGSFAAVAINFTSVAPAQTGYFTAFPTGTTRPLAATQVYIAGDVRSNLAIVRLDQGSAANELDVFSERNLHLVGDVVGYFISAPPTQLECVQTTVVEVSVAAGVGNNAYANACAAGYLATSTNCETNSFVSPLVFASNGACSARNNGTTPSVLRASRTCCRIPGR